MRMRICSRHEFKKYVKNKDKRQNNKFSYEPQTKKCSQTLFFSINLQHNATPATIWHFSLCLSLS